MNGKGLKGTIVQHHNSPETEHRIETAMTMSE